MVDEGAHAGLALGAIAADAVLAAPVESGALLLGGLDHVAYSHLGNNRRPLDPLVDFLPVGSVNRDSWVVVVATGSSIRSIRELSEAARSTTLGYASNGEGSTPHLLTARLARALQLHAVHVPYKDSFVPDLVAQRIQFVVAPLPAMLPHIRAGRLRALASLTDARLAVLEDVPSIREEGWPDQVFHGGLFLFAPAALTRIGQDIIRWLVAAVKRPEVQGHYAKAGIEPVHHDLAQVRAAVVDRLRLVDALREVVFGAKR